MVSLSGAPDGCPTPSDCRISRAAVEELLLRRPGLLLDGRRPSWEQLAERMSSMWIKDETILYVGLAGTSVARRVAQYYRTPLGAERPHAGGWPLKVLTDLNNLWVHFAPCAAPADAERTLLQVFASRVSPDSRAALHDTQLAIPFANLMMPGGPRKRHGITGARGPTQTSTHLSGLDQQVVESDARPTAARAPAAMDQAGATQRVTDADLRRGAIRIPSTAKSLFPAGKQPVEVVLRGAALRARWDPRNGPDRSRSGVLRIGAGLLETLVAPNEQLTIVAHDNGSITLE